MYYYNFKNYLVHRFLVVNQIIDAVNFFFYAINLVH